MIHGVCVRESSSVLMRTRAPAWRMEKILQSQGTNFDSTKLSFCETKTALVSPEWLASHLCVHLKSNVVSPSGQVYL